MIKWESMSHDEFTSEFAAARKEAERRMQQMAQLMGLATEGKRGRPAANPLAKFASSTDEEDAGADS